MMKPGTKLLFIALSCLTLASGCTKKKSSSSSKAPDKVEAKGDATGPIKPDPKPTPPKEDDAETPSPSGVTPAPAADPTKATPPKADTSSSTTTQTPGGVSSTPQATVTPKPEQAAAHKSDIEKYEDCVVPAVANLLGIERSKNAEVIEAKKLFETKLAILKSCQKPTSVAVDVAEAWVTKKIID